MKKLQRAVPEKFSELSRLKSSLPELQTRNLLSRYIVFEACLKDIIEERQFADFIAAIETDEFYKQLVSLIPKSYFQLLSEFRENAEVIINGMLKYQLGEGHSYVEPVFKLAKKEHEQPEEKWEIVPDVKQHILDNTEYKIFLFIANSGIGKTTLLLWLNKYILENFKDKVPIYIHSNDLDTPNWNRKLLEELKRTERENGSVLNRSFLDSDDKNILDFIEQTAQNKNLILLIDGLNESRSANFAKGVKRKFTGNIKILVARKEYVEEFERQNQNIPIEKIYLSPFSMANIAEYLGKDYEKLEDEIYENKALFQIPIVLRFAYDIYLKTGNFNFKSKFDLYSQIIREAKNNQRLKPLPPGPISFGQLVEILPYISFKALEKNIIKRIEENGKHEHFLAKTIKEYSEKNPYFQNVKEVMDAFRMHDSIFGIFTHREGIYEYYHQSFQEYFAAGYLAEQPVDEIKKYIMDNYMRGYSFDETGEFISPFDDILDFLGGILDTLTLEKLIKFIIADIHNTEMIEMGKLLIIDTLITGAVEEEHLMDFYLRCLNNQEKAELSKVMKFFTPKGHQSQ
ncbi:MAG: hypothetical protein PHV82_16985 [Victivallaceae bacterium]|nr:hypothetical protein [Victivallaceae bacterium]